MLVLPAATTSMCPPVKPMVIMGLYTLGVGAAFTTGLVLLMMDVDAGSTILMVSIWASVLSMLAANVLMSMIPKK